MALNRNKATDMLALAGRIVSRAWDAVGSALVSGTTDGQATELAATPAGELFTDGGPARAWDPITLSDNGNLLGKYRALRFDVGGQVKLSVVKSDGTRADITRNFSVGEYVPASCVIALWSTGTDTGVVVDGMV